MRLFLVTLAYALVAEAAHIVNLNGEEDGNTLQDQEYTLGDGQQTSDIGASFDRSGVSRTRGTDLFDSPSATKFASDEPHYAKESRKGSNEAYSETPKKGSNEAYSKTPKEASDERHYYATESKKGSNEAYLETPKEASDEPPATASRKALKGNGKDIFRASKDESGNFVLTPASQDEAVNQQHERIFNADDFEAAPSPKLRGNKSQDKITTEPIRHEPEAFQAQRLKPAAKGKQSTRKNASGLSKGGKSKQSPSGKTPGNLDERMRAVLEEHNEMRARHGVDALEWSDTLVKKAEIHLEQQNCGGLAHSHQELRREELLAFPGHEDDEELSVGENLAMGTPGIPHVGRWYDEIKKFGSQYGGSYQSTSGKTGHFTQMIWKSTQYLGCAIQVCGDTEHLTCEYFPMGNIIGMKGQIQPPVRG